MAQNSSTQQTSALHALAASLGVSRQYNGYDGTPATVPDETLRQVLRALGADVSSDDALAASLRERELAPWRSVLPPVVVTEQGSGDTVPVVSPAGAHVEVLLWPERRRAQAQELKPAASETVETRTEDGVQLQRVQYALPQELALGWYVLSVTGDAVEASGPHRIHVAITPSKISSTQRLQGASRWGYMAQLYSTMSSRSWGVGDLGDLASLAAVSGVQGADYVLINPLHAAEPAPPVEPSPYLPSSRRFFNPLYIRVPDVPEFAYLRPADREAVQRLAAIQRKAVLDPETIDRDSAFAAKLTALQLLFTVRRSPHRQQQLADFVAHGGRTLQDFGLWCALREELGPDSPEWEDGARTPNSPYAAQARSRLSHRIDFHVWMQWILDQQLEAAHRAACLAGMDIGVMHDLAVGVSKQGADAWLYQDAMAPGVSVGAPADMYNQLGQDWSQPPWHPQRLAQAGYQPWRNMLRNIFRHAGGIRIDHIMGLFRLWWIPDGNKASDGAYVYYDHKAMVGVLALEAELADIVVVGEDLGTVEPSVREYLSERGILGTSILWFEMDGYEPLDPAKYRELCMASVNTHDLPPTAGYLEGVQLALRERLGLLARSPQEERAAAKAQLDTFFRAVSEAGLLPEGADTDEEGKIEALYRYLGRAPSMLVNVSLVDAVGERRIQNQPGTSNEYPNWKVPLADQDGTPVMVEKLMRIPRVQHLVDAVNESLGTSARTWPTEYTPSQPENLDLADPLRPSTD